MKHHARAFTFVPALCALIPLVACQAIAGIKDRHYEAPPDAGAATPSSGSSQAACEAYCSDVTTACTDTFKVYPSQEVCMAVCMELPAGDPKAKNPTGNNVACRAKQARAAVETGEKDAYCTKAGPGGAGVCGTDCESYCYLYKKACPPDALDDCESACEGLDNDGTFNADKNHDGDTLQCRLVHVSNAAKDPTTHCPHARLAHPSAYCMEPDDMKPNCDQYCGLVTAECNGEHAVYENHAQCTNICWGLDPGVYGDQGQGAHQSADTVGCRLWHGYSAALDPMTHCSHAGPTGDGHCGDGSDVPNCAPYCKLLKVACPSDFDSAFGGAPSTPDSACRAACASLHGAAMNTGYSVATAAKDQSSLQCRMLYISRALAGDASACASATGHDQCQ